MFFIFAFVCSFALIGALVTPLLLIPKEDLILSDLRFSNAQINLLEEYIKKEKNTPSGWNDSRKKIIQQFNQLS